MPNLVISNVALGADPWLINTDTPLAVTVKNDGSADAARFYVGAKAVTADRNTINDLGQQNVASLAPGASTQVAFNANVTNATDYTITVVADVYNDVAESNENDNTKKLSATAVDQPDLPNLVFAPNGFTMTPDANPAQGYDINMVIANTGTVDVTIGFNVSFTWDTGAASDTFDPYQCCTTEGGPVIVAGATHGNVSNGGYHFPAPGAYQVYAVLDSDDVIHESNENDNKAEYDVTVP